jgi:hypothetical protein
MPIPLGSDGKPDSNLSTNPVMTSAPAVLITQALGGEAALLNAIVDNALYQIAAPANDLSQGNVVDLNTITFPSRVDGNDGIVSSATQGTRISHNTINHAAASVRAGIQLGTKQFRGNCFSGQGTGAQQQQRFCLTNADCNIPVYDQARNQVWYCVLPAKEDATWLASDSTIESNTINGPFGAGIVTAGRNMVVKGNTSTGPGVGITLIGKHALETAIVTNNSLSNVSPALNLTKTFQGQAPSFFGANITLNDFINYALAVQTSDDYDLPSFLSFSFCTFPLGKGDICCGGNYWGIPCPVGFDQTKVSTVEGMVNNAVTDLFPYGRSVSQLAPGNLIPPCRAPGEVILDTSDNSARSRVRKRVQKSNPPPAKKKPRRL